MKYSISHWGMQEIEAVPEYPFAHPNWPYIGTPDTWPAPQPRPYKPGNFKDRGDGGLSSQGWPLWGELTANALGWPDYYNANNIGP